MNIKLLKLHLILASLLLPSLFACTPQSISVEPTIGASLDSQPPTPTMAPTDEPTATPMAEPVTEVPTATDLPPESTNTPLPQPTIEPTATDSPAEPQLSYAVVGVSPDDTLNIRQGAGVDNEIIGEIEHNGVGISLIGEPIDVDGSLWVEIEYEDVSGWVNRSFLALQVGSPNPVADQAIEIIQAIEAKDFAAVAQYVHPEKGVRFSPYTYVRDTDIVFQADELSQAMDDPTEYLWGRFDGTGDPIELEFADYYLVFIYDANFAWPHTIGFNEFIGWSNTINNISDFYLDPQFVEYHFPGFDERYDGMDWRSLRLIFEEKDGEWYLVGIVHSEWTI